MPPLLNVTERRELTSRLHRTLDKALCRRLNAILLLDKGHSVSSTAALLAAGRSSVRRWLDWYQEAGLNGLESLQAGRRRRLPYAHITALLKALTALTPTDFGYQRSRWSTELLAMEINRMLNSTLCASTVRRWLPRIGIVWRRAAPTLHIKDPYKAEKMQAIEQALSQCSHKHPVFFEDEVDIHLNPKMGADWMPRGQQRRVATPGQNAKHYLAGALHAKTGRVLYVSGQSKDSGLFIAMLSKLRRTYRQAKSITLVVDNYIIHKSRKTQRWLADNPKFKLVFQPVYSPWVNRIERLWQALHETITRNHRCKTMWQLLGRVRHFMDTVSPFPGSGHGIRKVEHN